MHGHGEALACDSWRGTRTLQRCLQLQLLIAAGCQRVAAGADYRTITWTTPTVEPAHNTKNQAIIGGGMPVGNGETALLVFPLVPVTAPGPAPGPAPSPAACKGALVDGFCNMGHFIGCHDMSCQLGTGEQRCSATTQAAAELEAAKACEAQAECVAFSLMGINASHFVYEMAHNNAHVLSGFPDSSWTYFVRLPPP